MDGGMADTACYDTGQDATTVQCLAGMANERERERERDYCTVLYRWSASNNETVPTCALPQGVGFNVETLLRQFVLTLKLRKC